MDASALASMRLEKLSARKHQHVMIVAGNDIFRCGLLAFINDIAGFHVVAEANSDAKALEQLKAISLDSTLPPNRASSIVLNSLLIPQLGYPIYIDKFKYGC